MSNADDERSSTLPLLTWTSIVDDRPSAGRGSELFRAPTESPVPAPPPAIRPVAPSTLLAATPPLGDVDPIQPSSGTIVEPVGEFVLPSIREATPVDLYEPQVLAPSAIVLPKLAQVDQTTLPASSLSALAVSPLAVELPQRRKTKRRRRTGRRLVATLVFLCILIAGAVVFGRPYLFPDDWEANAEPYAAAVEDVTGAEIAEPLVVTAEPTAAYQRRATAQLAGEWQSQMPVWHALGLASGDVTEAGLDELLAGWSPALYSTDDGQIYHDAAITGPALEALITRSMASAQLDQQFGWAIGQPGRTLDDAALTSAHVLSQATAIQAATAFNTAIEPAPAAPLDFLPAVISYRALAPVMYAPLLAPAGPGAANPLADPATGSGPIAPESPTVADAPVVQDGDVIVSPPAAQDRSFWYLVLASHLDSPTAFAASEAVVESALTVVDRAGTTCAYGTFSGGDIAHTATLRAALESWVATVPAEFSGQFSIALDGSLQFVSCDPGGEFVGVNRIGTARELIGWRSAEIATIAGVVAAGGGETDIAGALARLADSGVGAMLAGSLAGDTLKQAADAAVAPIVTPPASPAPEPAD